MRHNTTSCFTLLGGKEYRLSLKPSHLSLGNSSKVDGLVNFEKLRMIAKEIRHVGQMAAVNTDPALMFRTR